MSSREEYFRREPLAFTIRLRDWTDDQAAGIAADHLARFVFSLSDQAARKLHAAMLHRRDRGHFEEAPESYAQALTELQRHEVLAWHHAVRGWLLPPGVGHLIHLHPAGDASENL